MIGEPQCRQILETAIQVSGVDECEAFLGTNELSLTRFANNTIHQNVSHSDSQLHIRCVIGKQQGRSTTNDLSIFGIVQCGEAARENAKLMPEDPDFPGLPETAPSTKVLAYDEPTAFLNPEARANIVQQITIHSERNKLMSAGFCRTGINERAVMSTKGTWAHHVGSIAGLLITSMTDSSAGWAKGSSWKIDDLQIEQLIEQASSKALSGKNPTTCQPGEYTVILSNYAVDDIISALNFYGMGAQMVQDGRSWMNGLQGHQAMSPLISIWDDGQDQNGCPAPFDCEGVVRQRVDIVDNGVVRNPVYNSYTAGKEGKLSTGHQISPVGGPSAHNLFMSPGIHSEDQLIQSTGYGIYITRFFYTRLVHSTGCTMTGMTRDGTFLIENGQITKPIKDLRFTQSYVGALKNAEMVGSENTLHINEGSSSTNVPAIKVNSFNFTGVTV